MKNRILLFLICLSANTLTAQPLNDIVKREIIVEKAPMNYESLRESDILYERRIWQIIDVREKMNQIFMYPEKPFFEILKKAHDSADLTFYSTEDDKFSTPLLPEEVKDIFFSSDTALIFDPESYDEDVVVVQNQINYEQVKRFRVKEVWFFNSKTSRMEVRILGLAPIIDVLDDAGNYLYQKPLFWVYYPELRKVLAHEEVYNVNQSSRITWEDIFERRQFSTTIFKENNVRDRRLNNYLTGRDALLEADKIKSGIFNYEHDVWSQ